jgi:predicted AAA+ superfamily ATPase
VDKLNRIAGKQIEKWLFRRKALILTGARQVGKTTMLRNIFANENTVLWLNADEGPVRERLSELSITNLQQVVGTHRILIIDEVQRIENAGLLLKLLVDNFPATQVIATGSSALDISERIFEPLTGRHLLFHLYPFGLAELYLDKSAFEIENQLPFHLIYGNYPEISLNRDIAKTLLTNLAGQYLYKDVLVWKDIRKPELLDKLLKLLAYQIGSEVSVHELATQLKVKSETVESYIDLLEKSFVVYRLTAYSTNPRKEVSKMSKIYFWDNGIRNAVIGNFDDLTIRRDVGELWENFIVSERMKINAWQHPDRQSYFWRNYNQREVDYVELENHQLSGFECKWNTKKKHKVTEAFTNSYPEAKTEVITPRNFVEFCGLGG